MKYENMNWVHLLKEYSILNSSKQFYQILGFVLTMLLSSSFAFGQCENNTGRVCDNLALLQSTEVDVTALVCDGSASNSFSVSAGGLYTVIITAGGAYEFTLTPSGNNTVDPIFPGVMDLFSDAIQTMPVASSGPVDATVGMTPTTLSYIDNDTQSETLFLSVMDKSCAGSWKDYTLTVTCTSCVLTSSTREIIAANETDFVSAASTFLAPTFTGPCDDATLELSADGGTNATLSNGVVSVPEGVEAGIYTLTFEVDNCAGARTTSTTELVVEPSSSCKSTNITLSALCTTSITPRDILTTVSGDNSQYTLFIDGLESSTVTTAGEFDVEVRFTPTMDGTAATVADTNNPFFNKILCSNTITVEDKSGPTCNLTNEDLEYNFVCGFETATAEPTFTDCSGTVTANDVVQLTIGNCGEIGNMTDGDNDLFNNLPITTMGVTIPIPTEAEASTLNGAGFALEKVLVNIYSASDGINTGTACEQFVYIYRPTVIATPGSAFVTCGLETTPTALAALDPQLVPYYVNPLYAADNSTMNDFTGMGVEDPDFVPTLVDDNGNPQFVAIAGQDHSVCAFTVTFADIPTTNPCGMTSKFVRRYTVLDCCFNTIVLDDASQFIETVDNVAPAFTDCPAAGELGSISNPRIEEINVSNVCATTIDFAAIRPTATDDCSDNLLSPITYTATFFLVADDFSGDGSSVAVGMNPSLEKGSYRAEVVATDDCGNISETCFVFLRVDDRVVPTVQCTSAAISVDGNGNAQVCASDRSNANDNCGTISSLEVKLMEQPDATFASCINVNCTDAVPDSTGTLVFNLVYRATDQSGNSNISMCPSELQIIVAPQFICPADVTVECSEYSNTANYGDPTIGGQCSQMFITSFSDSPLRLSCADSGTIVRTHTLSMNNAVVATCDQIISLDDTIDPTFDNAPADVTVECDAIPNGMDVTASDECTTATVTFADARTDGMCTDSYTLARTFTATDECSNTATFTQVITVQDMTNPIITTVLLDIVVGCNNVPVQNPNAVVATDNCDTEVTITVNDSDPINDDTCPNNDSFIRTFTATDNCGNSAVVTQMITIQPNPIQVIPANDQTLDCSLMDNFTFTPPTVIEDPSCISTNPVTTGPVITQETLDNGDVRMIGTFTVTDDCGITVSAVTAVIFENCCTNIGQPEFAILCFTNDNTGTIIVNLDANSELSESDLTFTATNVDDSSDVHVSVGSSTFTIDRPDPDVALEFEITVTANDPLITLCDFDSGAIICGALGRISGQIFNEEFTPLEEVEVELMNTEIPMSMTNDKGEYSFEGLGEQAYTIAAHKEKDPINGISTFDLVMMAQHVLGIQELGSPYKLIAADINMDETIDILDMVELRQLILFAIEDFSVNTSWRFVNANYIFPDPTNPWLETIPEIHNLEAPRTDVEHDFIAVKIGDLDCSAETRSNVTDVTPRENKTLVFETKNQSVSAGTTFDVALQPNQDVSISALQFTLDFDPSLATLVAVESTVLKAQDIAINKIFAQEGQVPFVWYNQQNVNLDSDQSITLTFAAKRDLDLVDLLDINSSLTKAAAYSSEGIGYKLSFEMLDQLDLNSSAKYTLYQNQPNPFQTETTIGFDVAQDEDVKLTIFNIEGKLLYTAEFNAQAGYNSVVISKEELQSTGVLFYQLNAADYTTTKKMIVLE